MTIYGRVALNICMPFSVGMQMIDNSALDWHSITVLK